MRGGHRWLFGPSGDQRGGSGVGGPVGLGRGEGAEALGTECRDHAAHLAAVTGESGKLAVEVDVAERVVRVDGAPAELEPVSELPLNRSYLLS